MPADPEIAALIEQFIHDQPLPVSQIVASVLSQGGIVGVVGWAAYRRFQKLETQISAIVKMNEEFATDNTSETILEILDKVAEKERRQHQHNRWMQKATHIIIRRLHGPGSAQEDELELELPEEL